MTIAWRRLAKAFGVSVIPAQFHFVTRTWRIGPNFHQFEPFASMLRDKRRGDEARLASRPGVAGQVLSAPYRRHLLGTNPPHA